jgi:hypothetical protein
MAHLGRARHNPPMLILDEREAIRRRRESIHVLEEQDVATVEIVDPRDEKNARLNEALRALFAEIDADVPPQAA